MASAWACCTVKSLVRCRTNGGVTLEGGKFEIEAVGEEPTSPATVVPTPVEPVTPEFPRTENCSSTPMGGAVWASAGGAAQNQAAVSPRLVRNLKLRNLDIAGLLPRTIRSYPGQYDLKDMSLRLSAPGLSGFWQSGVELPKALAAGADPNARGERGPTLPRSTPLTFGERRPGVRPGDDERCLAACHPEVVRFFGGSAASGDRQRGSPA